MRNSKFEKLITVILMAALLIGVFAVGTVFAEDGAVEEEPVVDTTPSVKVAFANLNFASRTEIAYAVEAKNLGEDDKVVMLFWDSEQAVEDYVYEKALYRKTAYGTDTIDGVECQLFLSRGIVPAAINNYVYARPAIKTATVVDGVVTYEYKYGEVFKYNIGEYAVDALMKTGNTEAQINLYETLIEYALAAGKMFGAGDVTFTLVKSTDTAGKFGTGLTSCAAPDENGNVLLRAETLNPQGKYFIKWVDENGETVSDSRAATVKVEKSGIVYYTPVYGELADSVYNNVLNLEALATGELVLGTPDLTKAPDKAGWDKFNKTAFKSYLLNYKNGKLSLGGYMTPDYNTDETLPTAEKFAPILGEDGKYTIISQDKFFVIDGEDGDKELELVRNTTKHNGWTFTYEAEGKTAKGVEFDVTYETLAGDGVRIHLSFYVKDANGKSVLVRNNISHTGTKGTFRIYAEGCSANHTLGSENYGKGWCCDEETNTIKTFDYVVGETVTFKAYLRVGTTLSDSYVDYYLNGEYFGSLALDNFTAFPAEFDVTTMYVTSAYSASMTTASETVIFDNVSLLK